MRKVHGRTDDMLLVRGENIFPSQVEALLLSVEGLSGNYQLVVDREAKHLDSLQVLVEASGHGDLEALKRSAEDTIKETIGLTCQVTVLSPGVLPRSEGKAKRVIDKREI
jgi:phenylacetate-CoA ligase